MDIKTWFSNQLILSKPIVSAEMFHRSSHFVFGYFLDSSSVCYCNFDSDKVCVQSAEAELPPHQALCIYRIIFVLSKHLLIDSNKNEKFSKNTKTILTMRKKKYMSRTACLAHAGEFGEDTITTFYSDGIKCM